jgi:putative FmdB family regulatory protein
MPIYEFYCADCYTIFSFYSKSINTEKRPLCPKCGKVKLERQMSMFSVGRRTGEEKDMEGDLLDRVDQGKMEQALAVLEKETEHLQEDDPRQAAQVIRKLFKATDLPMGEAVSEALNRLAAGEDPDQIEEEMGPLFENEDLLSPAQKKARALKQPRPRRDDRLYEL